MFILAKSFTNKKGEMFLKIFPKRIDYSYNDGFDGFRYGQELLCFCDIETAAQRLSI